MSDVVKSLLLALETELKQQQLWSGSVPEPAAMASTVPFCYDTMALEQWLQFIFLPRMHALLNSASPLPNKISVLPIASEAFKAHGKRAQPLLAIIARIDSILSGEA